MTRPIFGFAHSMGCAQLVHLSILHPRLLSGLIMIEPVIQAAPKGPNAGMLAALRPDLWTNRQEAAAPLRKSRTFKAWDKRVLDKYVQNMFRETPTALYPDGGKVTLKTTKHQESWSYNRGNFWPRGDMEFDRRLDPDLVGKPAGEMMFFRTESLVALSELPHVLPPVFWVFGGKSFLSPKEWITEKVETTGIGMGGSGGLGAGKVQHVVYDHGNHFVICERPKEVMKDVAAWLKNHGLAEFRKDESFWRERKTRKSKRDMLEVSDEWTKGVKEDASIKRPILAPGSKL
ncbi:MAG: hypothetical protein M1828_004511 [Chrysothrix sp. TS-e1954]|nr:MAG: hypothetical protein M1828_004511 [Chrysothrix sp. TS-e1954]